IRMLINRQIPVAFLAAFALLWPAAGAQARGLSSPEVSLLQTMNAARQVHGLAPLRVDFRLVRAARGHSADMMRRQYFAHGSVAGRAMAAGASGPLFGEDLAWETGLTAQWVVLLAEGDPAEEVLHQRGELDRVEGFRHVVDTPDVEPARPIAELRAGRQEDDRDRDRAVVVEQLFGDAPAVEPRHHHVEEDDVRRLAARLLDAGRAVCGLDDVHSLRLEVHSTEQADRSFVVDDENLRHPASTPAQPEAQTRSSSLGPPSNRPRCGRPSR